MLEGKFLSSCMKIYALIESTCASLTSTICRQTSVTDLFVSCILDARRYPHKSYRCVGTEGLGSLPSSEGQNANPMARAQTHPRRLLAKLAIIGDRSNCHKCWYPPHSLVQATVIHHQHSEIADRQHGAPSAYRRYRPVPR